MEEIKVGSIVKYQNDDLLFTVVNLHETEFRRLKADIENNDEKLFINDINVEELELINM